LNEELALQTSVSRTEFDRCQFRSGIYFTDLGVDYRAQCQGTRALVQQHNWVKGNQQKIDLARQHGAWSLASDAPLPVCRQRDLRAVVMTRDRPASLERLLLSLRSAAYPPGASVDVRVTVDRRQGQPHDARTLSILAEFDWPHGYFEVHLWPEPVGIFGQWVDSWPCEQFPADLYKAVVLFEDDLEVSTVYHEWFIGAHQAYASPDLGAVTGLRAQLMAQIGVAQPIEQLIPKGLQVFAYRLIATWSMSPTHDAWRRFRAWVRTAKADPGYDPAVDGTHPGEWYRGFKASGNEAGMWEIWFLRFMHDQNLYTLYPWIEDGAQAVVCNWREPGLHYSGDASRDFPLISGLPPSLLSQTVVPCVDWGLAFPTWTVWMSNPEIECISGSETVSCQPLASKTGPSFKDLALDERIAVNMQIAGGWMSGPVGQAFVYGNGDIVDCQSHAVYGSGGCGSLQAQSPRPCPTDAAMTVEFMVVILLVL
jgi:hypothetical protein